MCKVYVAIAGVNVRVVAGSDTVIGLASGDAIVSSSAFFPSLAASLRVANIRRVSNNSQPITSIITPRNTESLDSLCFSLCGSLSSISFEKDSRLKRIDSEAFYGSALESIIIPRDVDFIVGSALSNISQISISIQTGNSHFIVDSSFILD
jgi:hypothetical protein